jgi:hypothetical protein
LPQSRKARAEAFQNEISLEEISLKKSALAHSLQKRHVRATPEFAPMAIEA